MPKKSLKQKIVPLRVMEKRQVWLERRFKNCYYIVRYVRIELAEIEFYSCGHFQIAITIPIKRLIDLYNIKLVFPLDI